MVQRSDLIAESLATWFHAHGPFLLSSWSDVLTVGFATCYDTTSIGSTSVRQRLRRSRRLARALIIHDGPEQMLQSKAGYIDARRSPATRRTTFNARPTIHSSQFQTCCASIRGPAYLDEPDIVSLIAYVRKVQAKSHPGRPLSRISPNRALHPPFAALRPPSHCLATHPLYPCRCEAGPGAKAPGRVRPAN